MTYDMTATKGLLDKLINTKVKNVYYYEKYDGYPCFNQLADIQKIPTLGIVIETDRKQLFSITESDCSPNYDLGGIDILQINKSSENFDRPNHINQLVWSRYKGSAISAYKILNISHLYFDEKVILPAGIQFQFDNGEVLYLMNFYIENYDEKKSTYNLVNGQSLIIFFSEPAFLKQQLIELFSLYWNW